MHDKNGKKRRFFFHLPCFLGGGGEQKPSEIGTLGSMMPVTLNVYIFLSPIQMSSQSKFLKYLENLFKSFNQIWKHLSKCRLGCQSKRWGQKNQCHGQTG